MIDSGELFFALSHYNSRLQLRVTFLANSLIHIETFFSARYENEDPAVRFSEAQLTEIRKTTLAKIVCDNLDIPGEMQRAAFDLPSNFL